MNTPTPVTRTCGCSLVASLVFAWIVAALVLLATPWDKPGYALAAFIVALLLGPKLWAWMFGR
jgi:hypothetical protein